MITGEEFFEILGKFLKLGTVLHGQIVALRRPEEDGYQRLAESRSAGSSESVPVSSQSSQRVIPWAFLVSFVPFVVQVVGRCAEVKNPSASRLATSPNSEKVNEMPKPTVLVTEPMSERAMAYLSGAHGCRPRRGGRAYRRPTGWSCAPTRRCDQELLDQGRAAQGGRPGGRGAGEHRRARLPGRAASRWCTRPAANTLAVVDYTIGMIVAAQPPLLADDAGR